MLCYCTHNNVREVLEKLPSLDHDPQERESGEYPYQLGQGIDDEYVGACGVLGCADAHAYEFARGLTPNGDDEGETVAEAFAEAQRRALEFYAFVARETLF